jgi:ribosome biogenesis protein ERB1
MARKRPQAAEEEPTPAEDASPASSHEEEQEEEEEQFSGSLELDSGGSDDGEDGSSGSEEEEDDDESEEQSEEEVGAGSEEEDADDEDEDDGSGSDDDDSNSDDEQDHEQQVRDAIRDYAHTVAQEARAARDATAADADANPAAPPHDDPDDPATDSSEEERPHRNTVGDVPLKWYRAEEHIGYDADGKKIAKKGGADGRGGRDALDALVARADDPAGALLRNLYDEYNDEVVRLTDEEVRMVMRVRKGLFPHVEVDPHAPYVDWFSGDVSAVPLRGNTLAEPKRRFLPSKHEEAKVVKLVRALRAGWLKTRKEQRKAARRARQGMGGAGAGPSGLYLLWGEDDAGGGAGGDGDIRRTGASLTYLAPQKPRLPGHAESYRPPPEYVPTEEEVRAKSLASAEANGWPDDTGAADGVRRDADGTPVVLDEDGKREFVPRTHDSLRRVPAYARFVHERFERCLDLYLCPRVRRKRMHIDPETLVPQLPKPADLKPFPHQLAHRFVGHVGRVRCLAPHPAGGQWLATGGEDGCVRLWEVRTGRCVRRWRLGGGAKGGGAAAGAVVCVAWCPHPRPVCVLAAAVGRSVYLLPTGLGGEAGDLAAAAKLGAIEASAVVAGEGGEADEDGDEDDKQERLAAAAAARAAADAGSPGEPGPVKGEAQLREGDGQAGGLGEEGDLAAGGAPPKTEELCSWRSAPQPIGKGALELRHRFPVSHLAWHRGGDYFVTVAPTGNTQVSCF